MKFYSSRNRNYTVSADDAIVGNLCPDGGLFLPESIPVDDSLRNQPNLTLAEIGLKVAKTFLSESFSQQQLESICFSAFNFPVELIELDKSLCVLDLTKGPSLAFKDFGARFMAECLASIAAMRSQKYSVLTATSGDTGAAVAAALQGKSEISVTILYPKGRISPYQEGQMTKWGGNVKAIAVNGSFDDCQRLVKEAFADKELSQRLNLVSANSINISRLLAQMVYYLYAMRELEFRENLTFVVPSGNLGNITAGVFAARYCEYRCKFVAAHNRNVTFPEFLESGKFNPRDSLVSVSNAMDVGAPSNFERLKTFFNSDLGQMQAMIKGATVDDQETLEEMRRDWQEYSYLACPHTAVGLKAARAIEGFKVVLVTAAPAKFSEVLVKAGVPFETEQQHIFAPAPQYNIDASFERLAEVL